MYCCERGVKQQQTFCPSIKDVLITLNVPWLWQWVLISVHTAIYSFSYCDMSGFPACRVCLLVCARRPSLCTFGGLRIWRCTEHLGRHAAPWLYCNGSIVIMAPQMVLLQLSSVESSVTPNPHTPPVLVQTYCSNKSATWTSVSSGGTWQGKVLHYSAALQKHRPEKSCCFHANEANPWQMRARVICNANTLNSCHDNVLKHESENTTSKCLTSSILLDWK